MGLLVVLFTVRFTESIAVFTLPVYVLAHPRECRALLLVDQALPALGLYESYAAAATAAGDHAPEPRVIEVKSVSQLRAWVSTAVCSEIRWGGHVDLEGRIWWREHEAVRGFSDRLRDVADLEDEFAPTGEHQAVSNR
jgi:hypothetical protein